MINFNTIEIKRGIMHHVIAKQVGQEHASVKYEKTVFPIDDTVDKTIKERLVKAAGKDARAFELVIGNYSAGTFFDYAKDIKSLDDKGFVKVSKVIAELLAESQTRNNIPGGVIIILDCVEKQSNSALYIVIKAELHEAMRHTVREGVSTLRVLKDIFLSPSQKLYKIGMLFEREDSTKDAPNNQFTCFLFDEQFRVEGSKPAEYFYKDFLGFSTDENAKIQTARFYDQTYNFIINNVESSEEKIRLIDALKVEYINSVESTISPQDFPRKYFTDGNLKDLYNQEVANYLPSTIVKDNVLIKQQIERKNIFFPNSIKIAGKAREFDENVYLITDEEQIKTLSRDDNYTIVVIKGKPFDNA